MIMDCLESMFNAQECFKLCLQLIHDQAGQLAGLQACRALFSM